MATKLKNKASFKTLIIFLSVLSMIASFYFGSIAVMQYDCFGEDIVKSSLNNEKISVFDSTNVRNQVIQLTDDCHIVLSNGYTKFDEETRNKLYNNEETFDIADSMWRLDNSKIFKFYYKDNKTGKVLTNFDENDKIDTLLSTKKYALSVENGALVKTMDMPDDYDSLFVQYKYSLHVFFDINNFSDIEGIYYDNSDMFRALLQAEYFIDYDFLTNAVLCVALLLLSIILAIYSFTICGSKDSNGKTKLLFLDYIPIDIHLVITIGLGVCFGLLLALAYGAMYFDTSEIWAYKLAPFAIGACAGAIQLLLIEFFTSLVRLCKNHREWYKASLITFLIYLNIKLIKALHGFNKKQRSRIKEYLGYKPVAFKRRLILFLVGYGLLNLFFLIMCWVWCDYSTFSCNEMPLIVNSILWFAMNAVAVTFVTRYIVNLDKIISASKNRTVPNVDYQKLPNSLKILDDSLRYTNYELNRAVEKAVKDERMRTELITNVSHDLKTPLTSIINYVDLLKSCDIQDEKAKEYIDVLDEKGIKLKRLIEDLLEASKVSSGVITLNPVNLNLSELATQATVEHQQEFVNNNLELVFKGDKHNVIAFADGNKAYRVIENLLSNARKYSARGSRVYADVFEQNNTAVFEIKNISAEPLDISPDELKERFVRGDKSRANEGNGLGLSIADNLCKAMNGRLELIIDGDYFKARVILPKMK